VRIAERVWETWDERLAFKKPAIALLFTSDVPLQTALEALSEAIAQAMKPRIARAETAGPGEEFSTGYCSYARMPQGVVLRIAEGPDDFEGLLHGIAEGLRERGVDGAFDLYEPTVAPEIPEVVDLFECHLRLSGERVLRPNRKYDWNPDLDSLTKAVQTGIAWCRDNGDDLPLFLTVRLLPPVPLGHEDELERLMLEGIESAREVGVVYLTSSVPERFRTFAIKPSTGRVALIEGGTAVKDDWQTTVTRLTDVMRASAPWTVYAFIKRGSLFKSAILGSSLPNDWLEIPHMNALAGSREAFEDRSVPDAFGTQLLSTDHSEHIPGGPEWRVETLVAGRTLVEHIDSAAWFDGSLVRFGGHPNPFYDPYPPTPLILARAREDFDALLYRDKQPPPFADETSRSA
jgi:hypothetical protein